MIETLKRSFSARVLTALAVLLLLAPLAGAQSASGGPGWPITLLGTNTGSVYTNTIPAAAPTKWASTNSFPANFTNTIVTVTSTSTNTNVVTNTITGIVDITRQDNFCTQFSFSTTSGTNTTNQVVQQWVPSLDGVLFDTANTAFYITNVCNGTATVNSTTNFATALTGQFGYMMLTNIVVTGTAVLTNPIVYVGPKRKYAPY